MALSLILPCYNPQQGWERNIADAYAAFCGRVGGLAAELILVLDGASPAVTNEATQWLQQQVPALQVIRYAENMGKGYATRQGVARANGSIIIYTDVDIPYTIDSMCAVYECLASNAADVAVGVKDAAYYQHLSATRRFISRFLQLMIRTFLAMPVTDTQCGLKGFRAGVKPLFLATTINRYLFDLEFVRNCFAGKKYRVQPVPVTLNEQVHFSKMNYRILLPEMLNFIRLLFKKPHE